MLWGLFLLIAAVWAVFLIPPMWADRRSFLLNTGRRAARANGSASPSTEMYRNPADTQRARTIAAASRRNLARRRRVLVSLGIAAIATSVAFIAFDGAILATIHVLVDIVLVWYVVSLRRIAVRRRAAVLAQRVEEQAEATLTGPTVRVVQSR